jgi:hypothetical protein
MPYITHPGAPEKDQARKDAEMLAESLLKTQLLYEDYQVRIIECLHSRFEVRIEVPFRTVHLTASERQEAGPA